MTSSPSPYLAEHIREALAAGSTAELGVDVHVNAGGVYLAGTVASEEQRDALGAIAGHESGGLRVHNDIVVVHGVPDTDVEVIG